jgi:hypothetical protein
LSVFIFSSPVFLMKQATRTLADFGYWCLNRNPRPYGTDCYSILSAFFSYNGLISDPLPHHGLSVRCILNLFRGLSQSQICMLRRSNALISAPWMPNMLVARPPQSSRNRLISFQLSSVPHSFFFFLSTVVNIHLSQTLRGYSDPPSLPASPTTYQTSQVWRNRRLHDHRRGTWAVHIRRQSNSCQLIPPPRHESGAPNSAQHGPVNIRQPCDWYSPFTPEFSHSLTAATLIWSLNNPV